MKKRKKKKNLNKSIFDKKQRGNFITVKTSLKSVLKDYDNNFPVINKLVFT